MVIIKYQLNNSRKASDLQKGVCLNIKIHEIHKSNRLNNIIHQRKIGIQAET